MKRKRNCGNCCPICGHLLYLVGTESGMKRLCKSCGYREK